MSVTRGAPSSGTGLRIGAALLGIGLAACGTKQQPDGFAATSSSSVNVGSSAFASSEEPETPPPGSTPFGPASIPTYAVPDSFEPDAGIATGGSGGEPTVPMTPTGPIDEPAPADAGTPPLDVALPPVALTNDISYPAPGILLDERLPFEPGTLPLDEGRCDRIERLVLERRRSTLGMGVQFSAGLRGPGGFPLDAAKHIDCMTLHDVEGAELNPAVEAAPASGALTLVLLQPGETEEENQELHRAAVQLFLSRPHGERLAAYRWGATVRQLVDFTTFYDTFSDAVSERMPPLAEQPVDSSVAVQVARDALRTVASDGHRWARSVVVLAPKLQAAEQVRFDRDVNVLWAADATSLTGFEFVDTRFGSLDDAMGQVSARLNAVREAGFVTFGVCGNGDARNVELRAPASGSTLAVELLEAKSEERVGSCDPTQVAQFDYHDTQLMELRFTEQERQLYDALAEARDDTVDFDVTIQLSPEHGETTAAAHLRGSTSRIACSENRLSYTIDLEGGRERYLFSEADGAVGTDELYLIAMCLDPMYLNQYTADRLMAGFGVFSPPVRMLEVRLDGASQGVYLLMEKLKENLVRNHARVLSVIRRRDREPEIKFPSADDPDAQALALTAFEELEAGLAGLTGQERLDFLASRLDLHRYLFFVAFSSLIHNADWGDEPTFFATETVSGDGSVPFFTLNGWDPDDILKGQCDHPRDVMDDPYDLLGCADFSFEYALFGTDPQNSKQVADNEVYALYVEALQATLQHFTEEHIARAFDETARELQRFTGSPEVVAAMPDWSGEQDVDGAIDAAVAARKQAFAERRQYLLDQLAIYQQSR